MLQRLQYLPLVEACWLRNAIRDAVDAFYRSPDKVLLSDLVDSNDRLAELLHFEVQSGCSRTAAQRPKAAKSEGPKVLDNASVS